jgi:hypothetical protein
VNEEPGVGGILPSSVLQVAAVTIITVRHSHPGRGAEYLKPAELESMRTHCMQSRNGKDCTLLTVTKDDNGHFGTSRCITLQNTEQQGRASPLCQVPPGVQIMGQLTGQAAGGGMLDMSIFAPSPCHRLVTVQRKINKMLGHL